MLIRSSALLLSLLVPQPGITSEATILSGMVVPGGITCPILKTQDGKTVSLMGIRPADAPIGKDFDFSGTFVARSTCQQLPLTFRVDKILLSKPAAGKTQ
uniref:hypothetical protein n=1 Tax=Pararhizobium sp. IMCC3301 TaxID=3067904 RepID=UPI002742592A|nr:hypothetical protein [Pararhizobium sp. IMCC3301]